MSGCRERNASAGDETSGPVGTLLIILCARLGNRAGGRRKPEDYGESKIDMADAVCCNRQKTYGGADFLKCDGEISDDIQNLLLTLQVCNNYIRQINEDTGDRR